MVVVTVCAHLSCEVCKKKKRNHTSYNAILGNDGENIQVAFNVPKGMVLVPKDGWDLTRTGVRCPDCKEQT